MPLTLDPVIEQRIQRELERGHFRTPAEVIEHALNLLESEEDWLLQNKDAINERPEESFGATARGETYSPVEVRATLARDRTHRSAEAGSANF